jgi:uncharacterized protein
MGTREFTVLPGMKPAAEKPVRVDVFEFARLGQAYTGAVPVSAMPRLATMVDNTDGEVRFTYRGRVDAQGRPAGTLALDATLNLSCNHCDRPVAFALAVERDYYFVRDERALAAIAVDAAGEEPLIGDTRFDLGALVEEEVILGLPIAPRHDACQSEIEAAAATRDEDSAREPGPFAALAALRVAGADRRPKDQ